MTKKEESLGSRCHPALKVGDDDEGNKEQFQLFENSEMCSIVDHPLIQSFF